MKTIKRITIEYCNGRVEIIDVDNPEDKSNSWLNLHWQLLDDIKKSIIETMGNIFEIGLK